MSQILIGTHNRGKTTEFRRIFEPLGVRILDLDRLKISEEPPETGTTFEENAVLKARFYCALSNLPTIADDSGLEVDALGGAPGIYSARYGGKKSDKERNVYLLERLKDVPATERVARFRAVLAFVKAHDAVPLVAAAAVEGIILNEPRGTNGFGYDPLFYLPSEGKTTAELSARRKDELSHRGRAARKMFEKLRNNGL